MDNNDLAQYGSDQPLTISLLVRLGMIGQAVESKSHVAWLDDNNDRRTGIFRAFTNKDGNFLGRNEDVRDGYVWVTHTDGIGQTVFLPVRNFLWMLDNGCLALDYQP